MKTRQSCKKSNSVATLQHRTSDLCISAMGELCMCLKRLDSMETGTRRRTHRSAFKKHNFWPLGRVNHQKTPCLAPWCFNHKKTAFLPPGPFQSSKKQHFCAFGLFQLSKSNIFGPWGVSIIKKQHVCPLGRFSHQKQLSPFV